MDNETVVTMSVVTWIGLFVSAVVGAVLLSPLAAGYVAGSLVTVILFWLALLHAAKQFEDTAPFEIDS